MASRLQYRHRFLRLAQVRPKLNDPFRQPAASGIDKVARPPTGMTLIVLTPSTWAQPAASPACPSQDHHGRYRCDNKRYFLDETAQVSLVKDEYVIQKISATAPDPTLRNSILPRAGRAYASGFYAVGC
jgi:hypothetical protein